VVVEWSTNRLDLSPIESLPFTSCHSCLNLDMESACMIDACIGGEHVWSITLNRMGTWMCEGDEWRITWTTHLVGTWCVLVYISLQLSALRA
jgi:hypothetical protein